MHKRHAPVIAPAVTVRQFILKAERLSAYYKQLANQLASEGDHPLATRYLGHAQRLDNKANKSAFAAALLSLSAD